MNAVNPNGLQYTSMNLGSPVHAQNNPLRQSAGALSMSLVSVNAMNNSNNVGASQELMAAQKAKMKTRLSNIGARPGAAGGSLFGTNLSIDTLSQSQMASQMHPQHMNAAQAEHKANELLDHLRSGFLNKIKEVHFLEDQLEMARERETELMSALSKPGAIGGGTVSSSSPRSATK